MQETQAEKEETEQAKVDLKKYAPYFRWDSHVYIVHIVADVPKSEKNLKSKTRAAIGILNSTCNALYIPALVVHLFM